MNTGTDPGPTITGSRGATNTVAAIITAVLGRGCTGTGVTIEPGDSGCAKRSSALRCAIGNMRPRGCVAAGARGLNSQDRRPGPRAQPSGVVAMARTTTRYDVAQHLGTPGEMAACLEACLEEANGDAVSIAKALGDIARAKGMARLLLLRVCLPLFPQLLDEGGKAARLGVGGRVTSRRNPNTTATTSNRMCGCHPEPPCVRGTRQIVRSVVKGRRACGILHFAGYPYILRDRRKDAPTVSENSCKDLKHKI